MSNDTSISESDVIILGALRGGAAALCALVNAFMLAAILFHSDRTSPLHRLLIYVCFTSLLVLIANALQAESVGCSAPWHAPLCEFVGFANQFTACAMLLVSLWLISLVTLQYWYPNNRVILTPKLDVLMWGAIITLGLASASVPLLTDSYGMEWAWCWIRNKAEQLALWYGWVVTSMACSLLLLTTALCYSERRMAMYYESSRGINSCRQEGNRETARRTKALLCWMGLYTVIVSAAIALKQVPLLEKELLFLVVVGVLEPLSVITVPAIFLTHLYESRSRTKIVGRLTLPPPPPPPCPVPSSAPLVDSEAVSGIYQRESLPQFKRSVGWIQEREEDSSEELSSSLLLTQTLQSDYTDTI